MDIRNNFQDNNIIILSDQDFEVLKRERAVPFSHFGRQKYLKISSLQKGGDSGPIEWPVMVFTRNGAEGFFKADASLPVEAFLQRASLAYYEPAGQMLRMHEYRNLEELLLDSCHQLPEMPMVDFENNLEMSMHFVNKPIRQAVESALKEHEFKGMLTCCDCGLSCCASEFVWMKEGVCLLYIAVMAAGISEVKLLPFMTKKQMAFHSSS